MKWVKSRGVGLWLLVSLQAGCSVLAADTPASYATPVPQTAQAANASPAEVSSSGPQGVRLVSAAPALPCPTAPALELAPWESMTELSVEVLIERVLARNPSLAEMVAAWQAASARFPQVKSLEDPMVTGIIGPASIDSPDVDFAYRVEASQKFPFPGKLKLRGANALAEAAAAGNDIEDIRLQLVEIAKSAFADYYLIAQALEVNAEALRLLREFRDNAETRYRTGLAPQQDLLQADVEIGRQRERQLLLERLRQVAIARINTLMHLPPDAPLPPPPREITREGVLPEAYLLRAVALERRPDLKALAHRIAAEEANLALAYKEFKPDFEVMAAYDAFWQPREKDLRPMVGVRLNLPVYKSRRWAAVAEAQARVARRRAELDRQIDQTNFEVQQAYEQVRESEQVVRLYRETILPAADQNVQAAQAAYTTGKIPFLSLIEAERNLVGLRDRYYEAVADEFRRRAVLERVVGGPVVGPSCPGAEGGR